MSRSTLPAALILLACTGAPATTDLPPDDPRVAALATALERYEATGTTEDRDTVLLAAEPLLNLPNPGSRADVLLGDALANVALRPADGVPRLEAHEAELTDDEWDAYGDGLLRLHALDRLARAHARRYGEPLDVDHPTAQAIAHQADRDPKIGWRDLDRGMRAVRLVEEGQAERRLVLDRPLGDRVAMVAAALGYLTGDRDVELVAARTSLEGEADPLSTPGALPAAYGRRRVVAFASGAGADTLRPVGAALDDHIPLRLTVLYARIRLEGGTHLLLTFDAKRVSGALWAHSSNNPRRAVILLQAAQALQEAVEAGTPEAEAGRAIEQRFAASLFAPG